MDGRYSGDGGSIFKLIASWFIRMSRENVSSKCRCFFKLHSWVHSQTLAEDFPPARQPSPHRTPLPSLAYDNSVVTAPHEDSQPSSQEGRDHAGDAEARKGTFTCGLFGLVTQGF